MAQISGDIRQQLEELRSALPPNDERVTVIDALLSSERPQCAVLPSYEPRTDGRHDGIELHQDHAEMNELPEGGSESTPSASASSVARDRLAGLVASRNARPALWAAGVCACLMLANLVAGSQSKRPEHPDLPVRTSLSRPNADAAEAENSASKNPALSYVRRGLPDPALTPGDQTSGYSSKVPAPAPISAAASHAVLSKYGIDPSDGRYVVCRLIPSSLGGTDSPRNLFPVTSWFADLKGRLDRELARLVSRHSLSLHAAQRELRGGWIRAVHSHRLRNYGVRNDRVARGFDAAISQ